MLERSATAPRKTSSSCMEECNPDCDVERMEELRAYYDVQLDNIENALQKEEI